MSTLPVSSPTLLSETASLIEPGTQQLARLLVSEPSLPILGLQVHTAHLAFYIGVADRFQTFMLTEQALYPLNLIPYCPLFSFNLCVHVVCV